MENDFPQPVYPHGRFAKKDIVSQWIPEVEPLHRRAKELRSWRSRIGAVLVVCVIVSVAVFAVNLVTTIAFSLKYPTSNGNGILYTGTRVRAARLNTAIHAIINILSTLLLGASNLCMQLCVAPDRAELDRAHSQRKWLDIGAPSLRNLPWISRQRVALVVLLSLSSIPLHFMYNSAIFISLPINSYDYVVVNPRFIHGGFWENRLSIPYYMAHVPTRRINSILDRYNSNPAAFQRLSSNLECLQQYTTTFGNSSDLIIVSESNVAMNQNNSLLGEGVCSSERIHFPGSWACNTGRSFVGNQTYGFSGTNTADCAVWYDIEYFKGNTTAEKRKSREVMANRWHMFSRYQVSYCLSSQRSTEKLYSLGYSLSFMIAVCVANLCKCLGILLTAVRYWKTRNEPISVLGDAIVSYLEEPDPYTKGLGVCSIYDIKRHADLVKNSHSSRNDTDENGVDDSDTDENDTDETDTDKTPPWRLDMCLRWRPKKYRWFNSASQMRWLITLSLCITAFTVSFVMLLVGAISSASRVQSWSFSERLKFVFSEGFGKPSGENIIVWLGIGNDLVSLYKSVLFANVWQFVISFLYLLLNALVTTMLVGHEWSHFSQRRKPLRVSFPTGLQRSTFEISMPYRYGVPLMSAIAALHWTASQAIFVIRVILYSSDGQRDKGSMWSAGGYSTNAITASLGIAITIIVGVCGLGFRKYPTDMPLVSTCSAAISASCHPPEEDSDAAHFPVMWGVVEDKATGQVNCSFTTAVDARPLAAKDGWREWKKPGADCADSDSDAHSSVSSSETSSIITK